ncbi:carboxylesterase [Melampsora larici-populina 98AG31]|uniref:Carboxylesterase n=1 Tax=Melampsora larici-populina (strain 98AG31 / pathotype 3-4-7) TaxID=747676 RepID=F4RYN6_MELLP|nr:carboxylesterase [Melampsora larici-populina 98AG31]EGG02502.1 carboxylesterase [Melampsora larici-populina 98AG31]
MNLIVRCTTIPKRNPIAIIQFILLLLLIQAIHYVEAVNTLYNESQLQINTTSGRFIGLSTHLETPHPVSCWLGIPYAEKPIGPLRYKAPIPLINQTQSSESDQPLQTAWEFGNACPQGPSPDIPVPISEDCLSLNIYKPTEPPPSPKQKTFQSSHPLLPILVWIHGGGLTYGSSSQYDGSAIVSHSHGMKKPIIVITINYRLNSFGFLASDTLPVEDLSAGLQDQIAALKWIGVNAASFGGDVKNHRTSLELLSWTLVEQQGCNDLKSQFMDSLDCLRSLPEKLLTNLTGKLTQYGRFQKQIIWNPTWKIGSWINQRPSKNLKSNQFLKIPVIMGCNQDEGTYGGIGAVPSWSDEVIHDFNRYIDTSDPVTQKPMILDPNQNQDLSSNESDQLLSTFISNSSVFDLRTSNPNVLNRLIQLYPDQAELGAPYFTGNQTFGLPSSFKRLAAWFGDAHYEAPRRLMSSITSSRQPTYVYRFTGPRNTSESSFLGVHHSAEFALIFDSGWYQDLTDEDKVATYALSKKMRTYYINFVNELDPGKDWPLYKPESKLVMKLDKYNSSIIKDVWRIEAMDYMNSEEVFDMYSV